VPSIGDLGIHGAERVGEGPILLVHKKPISYLRAFGDSNVGSIGASRIGASKKCKSIVFRLVFQ